MAEIEIIHNEHGTLEHIKEQRSYQSPIELDQRT